MKCFYHGADFDGICSAAIVKRVHPECELIPCNYGDAIPPYTPGETVIIVDFSFPIEEMQRISDRAKLIWIDHHKTAIEDARKAGFLASGGQSLAVGTAGCELTWNWFYDTEFAYVPMPEAVYLLGRYDVWDHANVPGALDFQYALRAWSEYRDPSHQAWKALLDNDDLVVQARLDEGTVILRYEHARLKLVAQKRCYRVKFHGYNALCLNLPMANSTVFETVATEDDEIFLLWSSRGEGFYYSLYTTKDGIDVSAIAKMYGGGGHAKAAGFSHEILIHHTGK